MARSFLISLWVLLLASLGGSWAQQTQVSGQSAGDETLEGIAAIVNDVPISFSDVRQRARFLLLGFGNTTPSQEQLQQIAGQALEQLIDEKLQLQRALDFNLEISSADIDASIEDMARQSGITKHALVQQLLSSGINPSSLEEQKRASIAWQRIMSGLYGSRIRVSDNQIEDQLAQLRSASSKTRYLVYEIFLFAPDPQSKRQSRSVAFQIINQLRQGSPLTNIAQRFSSAPTAAAGGSMGWVSLDVFDEQRATAIESVAVPGLTSPIEVDTGIYILYVHAKAAPSERTSVVELARVDSNSGNIAALASVVERSNGCSSLGDITSESADLSLIPLGRVNITDLDETGIQLIKDVKEGGASEVIDAGSAKAVLFVCSREDNVENLPSRDQIKNQLLNQQLGMISQRSLRNLRWEAAIIRR